MKRILRGMTKATAACIALFVMAIAWRWYMGVELTPNDSELDPTPYNERWFVKRVSMWRYEFRNPIHQGLDVYPYEELREENRKALPLFCAVRYGTEDIDACYRQFCEPYVEEMMQMPMPKGWSPRDACWRHGAKEAEEQLKSARQAKARSP